MLIRWVAGLALFFVGLAAPAQAQIYSWRDANGHLVLSDRPQNVAPPKSYAVPSAQSVRATRFVPLSQSRLYDDLITHHAQLNGVRTDLVRAVVQVESGFNPYARSPKGALGLMQLMPATLRQFAVRNAFNPVENVRAGVAYLRQLLDRYADNEELALAAYNAGPKAVDRHGQSIPPYKETRNYVKRINKMAGPKVQASARSIYKTTEVIDGREVMLYSDRKPSSGPYELVR